MRTLLPGGSSAAPFLLVIVLVCVTPCGLAPGWEVPSGVSPPRHLAAGDRRGAVKARTATINQLTALLVTAPRE